MSLKYALAVRARITETKWLEKRVQHLAVVAPREALARLLTLDCEERARVCREG